VQFVVGGVVVVGEALVLRGEVQITRYAGRHTTDAGRGFDNGKLMPGEHDELLGVDRSVNQTRSGDVFKLGVGGSTVNCQS
jgi:hypothetical protein